MNIIIFSLLLVAGISTGHHIDGSCIFNLLKNNVDIADQLQEKFCEFVNQETIGGSIISTYNSVKNLLGPTCMLPELDDAAHAVGGAVTHLEDTVRETLGEVWMQNIVSQDVMRALCDVVKSLKTCISETPKKILQNVLQSVNNIICVDYASDDILNNVVKALDKGLKCDIGEKILKAAEAITDKEVLKRISVQINGILQKVSKALNLPGLLEPVCDLVTKGSKIVGRVGLGGSGGAILAM